MITFILVLIIVGVLVWLVRRSPIIDSTFKEIITWVVIFIMLIYLSKVLGLWPSIKSAFEV